MDGLEKYKIVLDGCDDFTEFEMELTQTEAELVDRIGILSKETSTYGCMPKLYIEKVV